MIFLFNIVYKVDWIFPILVIKQTEIDLIMANFSRNMQSQFISVNKHKLLVYL